MSVPFTKTDTSVGPPFVREVGRNSTFIWGFDAEEPVVSATARMYRLIPFTDVSSGVQTSPLVGNVANVTATGFVMGEEYIISVEFTNAAGVSWERTLRVNCTS